MTLQYSRRDEEGKRGCEARERRRGEGGERRRGQSMLVCPDPTTPVSIFSLSFSLPLFQRKVMANGAEGGYSKYHKIIEPMKAMNSPKDPSDMVERLDRNQGI
jgi:hypothetical protein